MQDKKKFNFEFLFSLLAKTKKCYIIRYENEQMKGSNQYGK